ncbi:MAG: class B sortase [Lachnospiraceae bacterium]|nr:class B sortase [Lachnospiraceae bacterium]
MKKKVNKRNIIFWCAIAVFFVSVGVIVVEFYGSLKSKSNFEDLRALIDEEQMTPESTTAPAETDEETSTNLISSETETSTTPALSEKETSTESSEEKESTSEIITTPEETVQEPKTVLKKYAKLYKLNNNMIGWIRINGTVIDYPVLWLEGDNDYYLEHNFYNEKSKYGQIILDSRCDFETPSTNLIFHGHHMADGTMFGSLRRYQKESYYNKHKYIQFDTIYEEGTYEIFAVFLSKIYNKDDKVFKYYNFIDAATEEAFDTYVAAVKTLSLYETGIIPEYGDELIALSTCEYSQDNGRLVVVARRLSPEEVEKLSKK